VLGVRFQEGMPEIPQNAEYLVKWESMSYHRAEWIEGEELMRLSPGKVRAFQKKLLNREIKKMPDIPEGCYIVDRVVAERGEGEAREVMVKWLALGYSQVREQEQSPPSTSLNLGPACPQWSWTTCMVLGQLVWLSSSRVRGRAPPLTLQHKPLPSPSIVHRLLNGRSPHASSTFNLAPKPSCMPAFEMHLPFSPFFPPRRSASTASATGHTHVRLTSSHLQ